MTERLVDLNGASLWLSEQGSGSPVLFLSGGPGCCDYLAPVASMVDDLAHAYRYEPRGCGRSSPDGPYDLSTTLSDIDGLRAHLDLDSWILAGHSAGASFALAYALEYPDRVRSLIYLSGGGIQNDRAWHDAYTSGRNQGLEQEIDYAYPPNPEVNREGNTSWRDYCHEPLLFRRLADLPTPMLAICGSKDIRPSWPVQQLAQLMPNASYSQIDGAGHNIWLTHAQELRLILRDFLFEPRYA